MPKLRAAVIGTGYLGRFHADKYAAHPDVDLVGVADTDPAAARQVAEKCQTRAYTDYRDLFGKVDAVSVVTPTASHHKVALDFLERDADVLIEKPVTETLEQADELIAMAESRGQIIQVGHLERFNPAVLALGPDIKKPLFIEAHRLSTYKPRAINVSVVLDLMIHDIDIILGLANAPLKSIQAAGAAVVSPHLDIANARLEFSTGCVANVTASRLALKDERKIRIFQRDGYFRVDFANRKITRIKPDPESRDAEIPGMTITEDQFDQADALAAEIAAFVHSVKTREVPLVSGPVGRNALEAALQISDQIQKTSSRLAKI